MHLPFTKRKSTTSITLKWQHIYELQMHQYEFPPIDVYKDWNERFIYISIPFDSQRITSRLFLTEDRYCSRGITTRHHTRNINKTLIPRRTARVHRDKLRFIPREFPRNILFPTPIGNNPRDALYVTR